MGRSAPFWIAPQSGLTARYRFDDCAAIKVESRDRFSDCRAFNNECDARRADSGAIEFDSRARFLIARQSAC
ncbi:MAG: hypothetical protein RLZZ450_2717 [Pseudomonadota bacterium]|jgi:hypothetical protein